MGLRPLLLVCALAAASCGGHAATSAVSSATPAASTAPAASVPESAAPLENNPPGDIPDTQKFTDYTSAAGGYHLQVPEGWAQSEHGSSVVYTDKLNSVSVEVFAAGGPRTPDTVRSTDEPKLRSTVRAFQEVKVEGVTLPAGPAVLLRYRANSARSDVTGKVYRLEVDRYEVYRNGKLAVISLSATAGSDNVDVWNTISHSFGWSS